MSATKMDYKRELRELYAPGPRPVIVDVPEFAFLMIDGHGDPNRAEEYREAIEALYAVAYTAKFAVKHAGGLDFGVMPLEGLWWAADPAAFTTGNKSAWDWTMMIMQPDQVSTAVVERACARVAAKKAAATVARLRFERFTEGRAAQLMYVGPYADEGPVIKRLHAFITEQGYALSGKHHEIYLSDPRRTAPEKLKTVIRQPLA